MIFRPRISISLGDFIFLLLRFYGYLESKVRKLLVLSLSLAFFATAHAAERRSAPDVFGTSDVSFLMTALGKMPESMALPVVLYFNAKGCVAWSSFGLSDGWESSAKASLASAATCESPTANAVLDKLSAGGIKLDAIAAESKPILIWYGSDTLCADCKSKTANQLPSLLGLLPADTRYIKLDWK